jgi:hypothetical protein
MIECISCCSDITDNNRVINIIKNIKLDSYFCSECIQYLLQTHFTKYINDIAKADCEKSLSQILAYPIPLNLTIDTLIGSRQLDNIIIKNKNIIPKLEKIITDEELIQLNIDLKLIHLKLLDPLYDYLYEIKIVLKKYNLI